MGVWSGLDRAVSHDGSGCLAGVESGGMESPTSTAGTVLNPTGTECGLDSTVLRDASNRTRVDRHCDALAIIERHSNGLLAGEQTGGMVARSLSGLGQFCCGTELHSVANEPSVSLEQNCENVPLPIAPPAIAHTATK